jgi:putative FmdB family regulatory protein
MPTYDYICSSCGRTTEIVHSINGGPPAACPACGAVGTLRKAFNPPTIHFKGSGWAKKDRSGGHSKPARASDAASTNGSGGESSSDSSHGHDGDSSGADSRPEPAAAKDAKSKDGSHGDGSGTGSDSKGGSTAPSSSSAAD